MDVYDHIRLVRMETRRISEISALIDISMQYSLIFIIFFHQVLQGMGFASLSQRVERPPCILAAFLSLINNMLQFFFSSLDAF